MNPRCLKAGLLVCIPLWGIIGSAAVLFAELRASDPDQGLVKLMILMIVCCVLLGALFIGFAMLDAKEEKLPPDHPVNDRTLPRSVRHAARHNPQLHRPRPNKRRFQR